MPHCQEKEKSLKKKRRREWRCPQRMWVDKNMIKRFGARAYRGRIRRVIKRGLPVKVAFHADGGFRSLTPTPLPGFTHFAPMCAVRRLYRDGWTYHSSLVLRKHTPSGWAPLSDPTWYPKMWAALNRVREAVKDEPTWRLHVSNVRLRTGVAYVSRDSMSSELANDVDTLRYWIGGHTQGLTVAM